MKKIYNAPYLKVVEVKNDIIATSDPSMGDAYTGGSHEARIDRRGMWDEDFDGEDLY